MFGESEENLKIILDKIADNKKMFFKSVEINEENEYVFKDFSMYENKEYVQKISEITFGTELKLETDIINMYERTYTHSISWAFNSKEKYKEEYYPFRSKEMKDKKIISEKEYEKYKWFDKIDELYRNDIRKDGETVGLLTGLVFSDILADFILSQIDSEIENLNEYEDGKFDFYHFKDNYTFHFYKNDTSVNANILSCIENIFNKFKFNLRKKILSNDNRFSKTFDKINANIITSYLEEIKSGEMQYWEVENYLYPYVDEFNKNETLNEIKDGIAEANNNLAEILKPFLSKRLSPTELFDYKWNVFEAGSKEYEILWVKRRRFLEKLINESWNITFNLKILKRINDYDIWNEHDFNVFKFWFFKLKEQKFELEAFAFLNIVIKEQDPELYEKQKNKCFENIKIVYNSKERESLLEEGGF